MKMKAYALAIVATTLIIACGSNSSEKETTATIDTANVATIDTPVVITDTAKTMAVNVPSKTKTVFEEKYPKATKVKWESHKTDTRGVEWDLTDWQEVDESGHNAWFHWQGSDRKAIYNDKGDWVGTVDEISDPKSLPAAVTNTINKQFGGYTVTALKRENDKNRTAYEVTLEKASEKIKALIHENGTVAKQKKMN